MTMAIPRHGMLGQLAPPAQPSVQPHAAVNVLVRLALYVFILSIPFEMPQRSIPIEIPTLTGAIFLLFTLIQPSACYRKIPGAMLWFVAYMWVFGLSTLVNRGDHTQLILIQFLSHVELLLILWVCANLLREKRVLRGVLLTYAFACSVRAGMQILGIAATATELWTGGYRITVLGQNPNLSAMILSAGLITLVNIRPRIITWPLAAMVGYAIIQTGSRGGLACAAVGLLALRWQGDTAWLRIRSIIFGLVAVTLLGVAAWNTPMVRARMEAAADEGSLAGRERIYPATMEMISERLWLGWGPTENQYEIAKRIGEEKKERRDAHNIVLELLSATGVIGAIPFLIGMAVVTWAGWRARKGSFRMLPFALLMTVYTGTMSGTWIASKILWLVFAIALATGAVVKEEERIACAG